MKAGLIVVSAIELKWEKKTLDTSWGLGIMVIVELTGSSYPAVRRAIDLYDKGGVAALKGNESPATSFARVIPRHAYLVSFTMDGQIVVAEFVST